MLYTFCNAGVQVAPGSVQSFAAGSVVYKLLLVPVSWLTLTRG
jgi:hypothetical protein